MSDDEKYTTENMVEGVDFVYDEKGRKVHPLTGKQLKGFALHRHKINKGGRPKGSRNKSTLLKSQLQIDSDTEYAAELWGALMRNDKEFLGTKDDVPLSLRQKAAKDIMDKAIANEKDKVPTTPKQIEEGHQEEEDTTPIFSAVPLSGGE